MATKPNPYRDVFMRVAGAVAERQPLVAHPCLSTDGLALTFDMGRHQHFGVVLHRDGTYTLATPRV